MKQNLKIPLRMCVSCRQMKEKSSLIKAIKSKDGKMEIDLHGKLFGRGAYVCKNKECIKKAQKVRGFERALKSALPKDFYDKLNEVSN